jgi:hypothetical protein
MTSDLPSLPLTVRSLEHYHISQNKIEDAGNRRAPYQNGDIHMSAVLLDECNLGVHCHITALTPRLLPYSMPLT